jgi:hypothetical protein
VGNFIFPAKRSRPYMPMCVSTCLRIQTSYHLGFVVNPCVEKETNAYLLIPTTTAVQN